MINHRVSTILLRQSGLKSNAFKTFNVLRSPSIEANLPSDSSDFRKNSSRYAMVGHNRHGHDGIFGFKSSDDLEELNMAPNDPEKKQKEQFKKANLGSMIEQIRILVPNILNKSLPKSVISNNVLLRVCPTHFQEYNAYIPTLKGHVSYFTTCKTLQFILTSVILNPKVQLHIQSIRTNSNSGDSALNFHGVNADSTKIIVRWTTCAEGCFHLSPNDTKETGTKIDTSSYHSTSDAKLGSHRWSKLDTLKLVNKTNNEDVIEIQGNSSPSLTNTLSHLTTGLIGLKKENKRLERVISGLFIFELNEDNDKINVHTIENVNVVEKSEPQDINGELRVC